MNKKEQNKVLTNLKREYRDTLDALDLILSDAVEALGYESDDDIAVDWVFDYLGGNTSLKDLRKKIAEEKASLEEMKKFG